MTKITISKEQLQILARVAGATSTDDSRLQITHVRIEPGLIVATDGHILRTEEFVGHDVTGSITLHAIKVAQLAKGATYVDIEVIDVGYPRWREVVPDAAAETDGVHPWVGAKVLTRFLKTLDTGENLQFRATRTNLAAIRVYAWRGGVPVFVGIVMPRRVFAGPKTRRPKRDTSETPCSSGLSI